MNTLNEKDSPEKASYGNKLGKRLKELREDKGLRQNVLAEACNVALSTYANWEQGRTLPPLNQIPVLADFFGVTTDYLLGVSKKEAADRLASRMQNLPEDSRAIVQSLVDKLMEKNN